MKKFLYVFSVFLLLCAQLYAADGDLIVNGNVGIGTTSPGAKLDVSDTVRFLSGPASSPYSGKGLELFYSNNADDGRILSYDRTADTYKPMQIWASTISLMQGNIGIGTTGPVTKLEIASGPDMVQLGLTNTGSGGRTWNIYSQQGGSGNFHIWEAGAPITRLFIQGGSGNVGIGATSPGGYKLYVNGSAYSTGGWGGSDIRWKKNIVPIENALESVLQLQGVNYEWKVEEYKDKNFDEGRQIGVIAQDVEKVLPELVRTDNEGYKAVSYEKLTVVLVEAIKEQQKQIKELEDRIKRLEKAH